MAKEWLEAALAEEPEDYDNIGLCLKKAIAKISAAINLVKNS